MFLNKELATVKETKLRSNLMAEGLKCGKHPKEREKKKKKKKKESQASLILTESRNKRTQ